MIYYLIDFTLLIIVFGVTNAGVIFILEKWGLIEYYDVHLSYRLITKYFHLPKTCFFCLAFWIAFIEILAFCFIGDFSFLYLFAAIGSAQLTVLVR